MLYILYIKQSTLEQNHDIENIILNIVGWYLSLLILIGYFLKDIIIDELLYLVYLIKYDNNRLSGQ